MTEPPKDLASLTSSIIASQAQRALQSQAKAQMSPQELKEVRTEANISKKPWGSSVQWDQREAQIRAMKATSSRQMQTTQTARGQVTLVGQPPKGPERKASEDI